MRSAEWKLLVVIQDCEQFLSLWLVNALVQLKKVLHRQNSGKLVAVLQLLREVR